MKTRIEKVTCYTISAVIAALILAVFILPAYAVTPEETLAASYRVLETAKAKSDALPSLLDLEEGTPEWDEAVEQHEESFEFTDNAIISNLIQRIKYLERINGVDHTALKEAAKE